MPCTIQRASLVGARRSRTIMTMTSIQAAQEKLEQGMIKLLQTQAWRSFLRFERAFSIYSWHNRLLLWAQNDKATYVAGFHTWRKLGRQVKRGEHGLMILAPLVSRAGTKDDQREQTKPTAQGTSGAAKETGILVTDKPLYGFRTVTVFDVTQTTGQRLPSMPTMDRLQGSSPWYERLCQVCPFPIVEASDLGGANGTYRARNGQIEILQGLDSAHKAKTLVHEWAHGLLHSDAIGRAQPREVKELEAESTAFVVCDALGLDTSAYSFSYLASWQGQEARERLIDCGPRIAKAAAVMLDALQKAAVHADISATCIVMSKEA